MKSFFAPFKVLMMSLIVALVLFPATLFNESTAEAAYGTYEPIYKEVFSKAIYAYTEDDIDYYVSECGAYRDVNLGSYSDYRTCDVYAAGIKHYRSDSQHSRHYAFVTEYDFYLLNSEWWYGITWRDTMNYANEGIGRVSENANAQKVFNIIYPKMQSLMRESENKERIAEEKRREERRKEQRIEAERKKIFNSLIAQGDSSYIAKDYVAAIRNYDEAKNVDKNSVDKFFSELVKNGDRLKSQGNYSAALDYYKKALTMNSSDSNCRSKLGDTYSKVKNFDDAVSFYKAMTTVYYENAYYWYCLAYSYGELGNYENAVTAYTNSIQFNPKDSVAYNNRGFAYKNLKQYERAIQDYDKAIQLNPNLYQAYTNRGVSYEHMKKYKKALKDYKKALELDPNNKNAQKGIERVSKTK